MKNFIYCLLALTIFSCNSDDLTNDSVGSSPVITSILINNDNILAGDDISISAIVSDSDNDIVTYNWSVSGGSFDRVSDTSIIWHSPQEAGNYIITLTVTDSENNVTTKSENVTLELVPDTFQLFLDASYIRMHSDSETVIIDRYIYFYSAEKIGLNIGTSFRLKKIDQNGNEIWTKTYANFFDRSASIRDMYKTPDNNLIMAGDNIIIKVNTEGDILWSFEDQFLKRFVEMDNGNYFFIGGMFNGVLMPTYTILTPDGVFVEQGLIEADYKIGSVADIAIGPEPDTFFVVAWVPNPENPSAILHINSSGEVLNAFRFPYHSHRRAHLFRENNGTYSAFFSTTFNLDKRINWVTITDTGDLISDYSYSFEHHNEAFDVEPLSQGGYLIAGALGFSLGSARSLMMRINSSGQIQWLNEYGSNSSYMDFASSILELENGKIIVTGSTVTYPDYTLRAYIHKYNADGSL